MREVHVGAERTGQDGCRRYLALAISFDTRAYWLTAKIGDWDDPVREQWLATRRGIRTGLIHEYGNEDHERKIDDFTAIGIAPWTIRDEHNVFLQQVRAAFTLGTYYPALVGACALGERLLNELILRMRDDYADHPSTCRIKDQASIGNWSACISVLVDWGVLDEQTATTFNDLRKLRNKSIHYGKHLSGTDAREDALAAVTSVQSVIAALFPPHGGPPKFIEGTEGHTFLTLASENEPLVKRFYVPACVLVSPNFEMRPTLGSEVRAVVFDDEGYQDEFPVLSDMQYAEHRREPRRKAHGSG